MPVKALQIPPQVGYQSRRQRFGKSIHSSTCVKPQRAIHASELEQKYYEIKRCLNSNSVDVLFESKIFESENQDGIVYGSKIQVNSLK